MNSRERIRKTLAHRQPDRMAVDFGSTAVTGMHATCVAQLRAHYGLERRPVKIWEPFQMLGDIEDDLAAVIGVDTARLQGPANMFGFPNENWKEFRAPWGQILLVPEKFVTRLEPNGDLVLFPQGDDTVPPSGRMPRGGFFFDAIPRQNPIDDARLNPADNLEEFGPVSDADLAYFRDQAASLRGAVRAVVGGVGGTAFGDIALVPGLFLKHPRGIREVSEWYVSTVARRDYVHAVFTAQCEMALRNLDRVARVVGDAMDVIFVCGTDFGTQTSSFCSLDTYRELYHPYYRQVNDWIHRHTSWKSFKHSCGAVGNFIEAFIESGFDIVNPMQFSAAGMDPAELKRRFGDRIVFWGGGVDTQKTLPFGTPAEVRRQVLERCAILAPGGGFIFNAIHNVQANTPTANIVAMIEAVREFNGQGR